MRSSAIRPAPPVCGALHARRPPRLAVEGIDADDVLRAPREAEGEAGRDARPLVLRPDPELELDDHAPVRADPGRSAPRPSRGAAEADLRVDGEAIAPVAREEVAPQVAVHEHGLERGE